MGPFLAGNTLLLLRHAGTRIGECVDLSLDCVRPLGLDQIGSALCANLMHKIRAVYYCHGRAVVIC
jgi:hypothetical protein